MGATLAIEANFQTWRLKGEEEASDSTNGCFQLTDEAHEQSDT